MKKGAVRLANRLEEAARRGRVGYAIPSETVIQTLKEFGDGVTHEVPMAPNELVEEIVTQIAEGRVRVKPVVMRDREAG